MTILESSILRGCKMFLGMSLAKLILQYLGVTRCGLFDKLVVNLQHHLPQFEANTEMNKSLPLPDNSYNLEE